MKLPEQIQARVDFFKEVFREYGRDNSALMAAAVSFYVFMSLIPLLLIAAAAFGFILSSKEHAYHAVLGFLRAYAPSLAERGSGGAVDLLEGIIQGSSAATWIGVVALLWSGSQAFVNLETAVNIAWNCKPRGFFAGRLISIFLLLLVGTLLIASFGVTTVAEAIEQANYTVLGHNVSQLFGTLWQIATFLLPLVVTILTFVLIYKVLPNTHVTMKAAFVGGIVAGALWETAKYIFSYYVTHFANYSAVYGSLGGIILLLVWIYYSSAFTILGAQAASVYQARHEKP